MKGRLFITFVVALFVGCGGSTSQEEAKKAKFKAVNRSAMAVHRSSLVLTLPPESLVYGSEIQFKNLKHYREDVKGETIKFTLCGELNAKNKYGRYIGYQEFVSFYSIDTRSHDPDKSQFRTSVLKSGDDEEARKKHKEFAATACQGHEVEIT